jgi:hypothetical protein
VDGKKKPRIELTISVSAGVARGLDIRDIESSFEKLGKQKKNPITIGRKVAATVVRM